MRGAQIVADTLESGGVDHVFGVAGSAVLGTLDAIARSDIEYVPARHEQVAASMATGYALASRRPTGSISHVGPGAANQIIAIAAAYRENAPVISITGNEPSYRLGNDVRHEWDVLNIFREFTKHNVRLTPDDTHKQVRDAVLRSVTGMPGPVHIDIPRDLEETDVPAPDDVAYRRLERKDLRASTVTARPAGESVDRVVDLLAGAERPVLIVGNEVRWFDADRRVREFAERLDIPVATSHNARGALPESHRLSLGVAGRTGLEPTNEYIEGADLVLGVGTRFSDITTDNWELLSDDAAIVQATIRSRELDRHYLADVAVFADPRSFLSDLLEALSTTSTSLDFGAVAADQREAYERAWEGYLDPSKNPAEDGVDPRHVIRTIHRTAGDYAYTTGGGVHSRFGKKLPVESLNHTFTTSNFAGMSQGFPLAMGAQLAIDTQLVTIEGDGGFAMVIQDLETAVREDIPVKIVVLNNDGLFSQAARQKRYYGERYTGTMYPNPNFDEVAKNFGLFGERVTEDDAVPDAVERLFETDGPGLLDVRIDPWVGTGEYDRD